MRNFRWAKLFVGRNFRHPTKNSSLSPDEKFRLSKVKVSLIEVHVNLTEKQVIYANHCYLVWQNFVGQNFCQFSKNASLLPEKVSPDKITTIAALRNH